MSYSQILPQSRKRKAIAEDIFTPHMYQQFAQNRVCRQGVQRPVPPHIKQQMAIRPATTLHYPQIHVNAPTNAQLAAYKDAVITNAWYDEWQKEPERFGPARPMTVLNQPAKINLSWHSLRTKDVHLNHWDCAHEPEGTLTQRREQEQERTRKREKISVMENVKQDQRRVLVKQAAQNAQVIDLTEDDAPSDTQLWMYHGTENMENHAPSWNDRLWESLEVITGYDDFLSGLSFDLPAQNTSCCTTWIPQNAYSSQQNYGVF